MPVSGTVLNLNEDLESDPQLVNSDPYGNGWMVEITISNPAELEDLMSAEDYQAMVG
jgi:glycine cleavage system H protein